VQPSQYQRVACCKWTSSNAWLISA
jgi:hypothetical protein